MSRAGAAGALVIFLSIAVSGCARPHALERAPEGGEALHARRLYEQGMALQAAGDLTRAEQYLATAHRAAGRDRASLVALLSVCVRASRLRSALAHAQPYLHDHPRDVHLQTLVASIHFALGELAQARSALEHALFVREAQPDAHYLLGRVQRELGARLGPSGRVHRREARRHFARYLALAPDGTHAEEARAALVDSTRIVAR